MSASANSALKSIDTEYFKESSFAVLRIFIKESVTVFAQTYLIQTTIRKILIY